MTIFNLIVPIYSIVLLGWYLQKSGAYTPEVNKFISFITYRIMLPLSIFMKISTAEMGITRQTILFYSIMFTLLAIFFILYQLFSPKNGFECFVNSVRGNSIYLGFPVMMQLLPAEILPVGMVLASALSPSTIFGIEVFYRFNRHKKVDGTMRKTSFLKNPLIQGLLLGLLFNTFNIWHPLLGDVIGQITKPVMFLSLIIVGANFNSTSLRKAELSGRMILIILSKLLVMPALFWGAATLLNFDPAYTAIGIILFSTPGAVSNYVILSELGEASDLTVNVTIFGTAAFLLLLPILGYLTQIIL